MNQTRYTGNNLTTFSDLFGLWKANVHRGKTFDWCVIVASYGFKTGACSDIADANEGTDTIGSGTSPFPAIGDQSYHFNRNFSSSTDSRLQHQQNRIQEAKRLCFTFPCHLGMAKLAAKHLGIGLHALQDYYAHGNYGWIDRPDILIKHNTYGTTCPGATSDVSDYPDDIALDAVGGPGGRPDGIAIKTKTVYVGIFPILVDYADYTLGTTRITDTESSTKSALLDFYNYLANDPLMCACREYFTKL